MARMNLWREALFRFQRAVQLDPGDAMLHNNLAVAYEANGDFENAAKAYREAMRLDKSNQYIQRNYSRFVEFNSRNKKRQLPVTVTATAQAAAPADVQTPQTPAAPPPGTEPPAEPAAQPPAAPEPLPQPVPPPAPQPAPPGGDR